MNAILMMMGRARPPQGGNYIWAQGATGDRTVSWSNPNVASMQLMLTPWNDSNLSWMTSSPVTINGGAGALITARLAVSGNTPTMDSVFLNWVCEGDPGKVETRADYYET